MRTLSRSKAAFTLLELIVTIVILAVLAAIAVPTFTNVMDRSRLEAAEVTAAALSRETVALAALDGGPITAAHVDAAAADLPGEAAAGPGTVAAGLGALVRHGQWEFSGGPRILSVRLSSDPAPVMGTAVWVPGSGCALARAVSGSSTVETWHTTDVEQVNCSGNLAVTEEDPKRLKAPAMPSVRIGANPLSCPAGTWLTWDGSEPVDIYIGGAYAGTSAGGYCAPAGTRAEDAVAVVRKGGAPAGQPGGWDGGAGELLSDNVGGVPQPGETRTNGDIALTGARSVRVTSPVAGPAEVWRSNTDGTSPTRVGTLAAGVSDFYETAPAGSWRYTVRTADGRVLNTTVGETQSPTAPEGGSGPAANVLLDGSITVSWGLIPQSPEAPVDGYRLYRATGTTGPWENVYRQLDAYTDTTLDEQPGNGTWCYRLSAFGPGGESALTTPVCATIQIAPKAPGAVKELTATSGDKQVSLAWKMPDTYGSPIQRYTVTVTPTTGVTGTTTRTTTAPGMVFDGLSNWNRYTFTVTATNGVGTGPGTTVQSVPTGPLGPIGDYHSEVMADQPGAYYRLDEVSGTTAADASGSNRNGNYVAGPTLGTAGAVTGTAVTFNGSGQYVNLPSSSLGTTMTVEVWFKTTTTSGVPLVGAADRAPGSGTPTRFQPMLWVGGDGYLRGDMTGSNAVMAATTAPKVNDGQWHQAALVTSGSRQALYLDGVEVVSRNGTIIGNFSTLAIGATFGLSGAYPGMPNMQWVYMNGTIDSVSFYPKALDGGRMYVHHQAATSR